MAQNAEDKAKAAAIVAGWTWQPAEGHNYRYRYATRTLTRFYEAASMQPDEVKLVVEYLRDQEIAAGEGISLLNRTVDFGEGWKAKDAWYQTTPGEKFANTDSTKIRVYQILFQTPEDKSGDGPYSVENGCAYKSTHTFYWDVEELPTLPASSSGVEYSMKGVTRDGETGLFSCVVEKRERVQQDVADYVTQETVFEKRSEEQHIGVKADKVSSTGKAASVADGKIVTRKITKNADCTSDVANTTITEVQVAGASETVSVGLTGTTKTTVNRNMADKAATDSLDVGDRVENVKTEGGRWTQTITKFVKSAAKKIAESCRKTLFEHTHSTTNVQGTDPGFDHSAVARGGKIVEKSVRRTADGAYQIDEQTTEEKGVTDSVVTVRKTLRGTVKTTLDRNQQTAAETTGLSVGDEVRVEKTPGGLYNNTKSGVTNEAAGEIQRSCEKSGDVRHTDATTKNVTDDPGKDCVSADANVVNRKTVRKTEEGTFDVTDEKTTYAPKTTTTYGGSANARETTTSGINQTIIPEASPGTNQKVEISASANEHGSYSTTKHVTTYKPATATSTTHWATEDSHTTVTRHNPAASVTAGGYGTSSASPDDNGAATTEVTTYTPTAVDSGWIKWTSETKTANGVYYYKHGYRVFCNLSAPPTVEGGNNISLSVRINKFGRYDGSMSFTDLYAWNAGASAGTEGGSHEGTKILIEHRKNEDTGKNQTRTVTLKVRAFYGRGNEGARAQARAQGYLYPGVHLANDTYITSITEGAWKDDE